MADEQRIERERLESAEKALRSLLGEVEFMIRGGDEPSERCTECGHYGEGMVKDALKEARAHLARYLAPAVGRRTLREMTVGPPADWTAEQIADFKGRFEEFSRRGLEAELFHGMPTEAAPAPQAVKYAGRRGPADAELVDLRSNPPEVLCKLARPDDYGKTLADCQPYANPMTFRGHPHIPIPEHTHVFPDGPGASVKCEHCPKVESRQRLAAIVQETQAALRGHDLSPECPCGIALADCTYHRAL